jgi:phenylacetate-CoA ligase
MHHQKFQFNWLALPDKRRVLVEAMQFQFSQTQKFSRGELARLQFACLQRLIDHCIKNVPYYKNGTYSRIESWQDWSRVPVLSRSEVQEHGKSLRADINMRSREGRSYKKRSSGSTGRPIEVLVTERTDKFWQAITIRDHLWHQRDFSQTLAVIKNLGKDRTGPPGITSRSWGKSSGLLYSTGPSVTISSSTDIAGQYDWLARLKPGYLLTYPSILRALAERNLAADDPVQLLGITTIGENISPETRHFAQRAFGGKVCDIYSCQEVGYLALQCPRDDHYHIQAETALVEVLDDNNRACAPGEMGRVVVTHLHNHAMPLIRYDIGDYAIAGGDCDCGINLPVLERVIGRTRNLVSYPDGTRSWPAYGMMKLVEILPNVQFQLVQKSLDTMLLRIGTKKSVSEDMLEEMKNIVNSAMDFPFTIQFELIEQIPRSASGKFEDFVSEIEHA